MEQQEQFKSENQVSEETVVRILIEWSKSLEVFPTIKLIECCCAFFKEVTRTDKEIRSSIEHLIVMAIPGSRGVDLFKMYLIKDQLVEACLRKLKAAAV